MLAQTLPSLVLTEADYLDQEQSAKERHEYVDGQVFAMAAASKAHNEIALNLALALRYLSKGSSCRVFMSDMNTRISQRNSYYYPDVLLTCEPNQENSEYFVDRPCLVIEVVSKSTEWKDYHEKLLAYQSLASVKNYWVVAQERYEVTCFYRDQQGQWWVKTYTSLEQFITVDCLQAQISLTEIYAGLQFPAPA